MKFVYTDNTTYSIPRPKTYIKTSNVTPESSNSDNGINVCGTPVDIYTIKHIHIFMVYNIEVKFNEPQSLSIASFVGQRR